MGVHVASVWTAVVALTVALVSCATDGDAPEALAPDMTASRVEFPADVVASAGAEDAAPPTRFGLADIELAGAESESLDAGERPESPKRLMVYTARFELLVSKVEASLNEFLAAVEEAGGYLEQREDAVVTCRVPAKHFDSILVKVRSLGSVVAESIRAQEVTKQYFDLKLRIETAETARKRLLALLEKAEKVEDILKIESEIRRLTEEIEKLNGELRFLSDKIAYSKVEVRFSSVAPAPIPIPRRERSRFEWINQVGVENVLRRF